MVKNLLGNAGDTGLIPGLGRFHIPRSNEACVPQPLSPGSAAGEATAMRSLHIATREQPLLAATKEKPVQFEHPAQPKINK